MEDQRLHHGYSHAHATRLASKPSKHTTPSKPTAVSKRTTASKRALANGSVNNTPGPRKSLVDAFKQHGMKLCDGTKLNAVGKAIQCIGSVPPAVSVSITALFLSQNNLRTLDGIEQFTSSMRLLSIGGNLLTLFSEVERLAKLPRLRNLNLMGNPICDHPNYRFRVLDTLPQLQVLDTADVTPKERELAPRVASQDKALRVMVLRHHFEIQQLQQITRLITLRTDFYGFVLAHTGSSNNHSLLAFDRIPNPHEAQVDVAMLLKLWRYDQRLSGGELKALEIQMGTIVMRTHNKLAEHPKLRAKEFLLQLAGAKCGKKQSGTSDNQSQSASSWQVAYESVIALQQQTIANLQSLCERNNRELVASLKTLLTTDPSRRRQLVNVNWNGTHREAMETSVSESQSRDRLHLSGGAASLKKQLLLPPQQQDPDQFEPRERQPKRPQKTRSCHLARDQCDDAIASSDQFHSDCQDQHRTLQRKQKQHEPGNACRFSEVRNEELDNQTQSKAIHHFQLRESSARAAAAAPLKTCAPSADVSTCYSHLKQPRVFMIQHERPVSLPDMTFESKSISSLAEHKSAFCPVTSRGFPAKLALDDDDAHECHDLAVLMNQRDNVASAYRDVRARRRASAVDESVETSSSVSNSSNTSSFWRGSRGANTVDRELPPPPANTIERRDLRAGEPDNRINTNTGRLPEPGSGGEDRYHELEEREAKYIKALIESEQRELTLRNQLTTFKKKLSQYQQSMAQELQEQQQIKNEVNERVQNVAAPKVLRRFFIRWIHFYHWSLQLSHFHRRRCFILKHDWFWRWRRKLWTQQQLRAIHSKAQTHTVQRHFAQWVNLSRLRVITNFTRERHQRRRLGELFQAWRQSVKTILRLRLAFDSRAQEAVQRHQRGCFYQWAGLTRHRRHLKTVLDLHSRRSHRVIQEITFCRWKLVMLAHARPLRAKVELFVSSKQSQYLRELFLGWKNLAKGNKLYFQQLSCRVWRHWTTRFRSQKAERETAARSRRLVLKDRIQSWRVVTVDRIASRRSLSLAKRYVNQRRLRKLWLYWKCYTFVKRKYIQGSTKALKHYFVKLLRTSWLNWKRKTRKNLMSVRKQKHSELQRHFQALKTGVKLSVAAKCRARLLRHLKTRCNRTRVRQWLVQWRGVTRRRRTAKQSHQVLARQSLKALLQSSWSHWLGSYMMQVRAKLQSAGQHYEQVVVEKHEVEAELLKVNGRMVTLNEQLQSFEGSIRAQEREIATYQSDLLHSEELRVALEKKIKTLEDSHSQERQQWAEMECQLSEQRATKQQQARSIAEDNSNLQRQLQELQAKLIDEQQRTLEANRKVEVSSQELSKAQQSHVTGVNQLTGAYTELEQCIADLKLQLQEEQQQKDETANRLQEYELRLATTCADINQHEEAHERENERLRGERQVMEARVSEEQVRNAELQRLVEEKNAIIHCLTQQQNANQSRREYQQQPQPTTVPLSNEFDLKSDSEPVPPSPSRQQQQTHSESSPRASEYENETRRRSTTQLSTPETTISSLLKDINQSILVRTGMVETHIKPDQHVHQSTTDREWCTEHHRVGEPARSHERPTLKANRRVEDEADGQLDEHANKVHEDIRQLQMRIASRLKQTPTGVQASSNLDRFRVTSPCSSSSSFSSDEESEVAESEALRSRATMSASAGRRARDTGRSASQHKPSVSKARAPRKAPPGSENVSKIANALPKRALLHSSKPSESFGGGPGAAVKKRTTGTVVATSRSSSIAAGRTRSARSRPPGSK